MLDPYLLAADTNSLSDRIDEKLPMLADYINKSDTAAMLDPYLLSADTSDTASMLITSTRAIRGYVGSVLISSR
jgi:hypothetical protein